MVGDKLIHIESRAKGEFGLGLGPFRHRICVAAPSEEDIHNKSGSGYSKFVPANDRPQWYIEPESRHSLCKPWNSGRPEGTISKLRLDLSILGACRLIYEEANNVLWLTNTFSFEDCTSLLQYVRSLNVNQRNKLKTLHFETGVPCFHCLQFTHLTHLELLSTLSGIRSLLITIHLRSFCGPIFGESDDAESYTEPLSRLQTLPLTYVTVTIIGDTRPIDLGYGKYSTYRWTVAQKRQTAEKLRSRLLDPRGNDIVAEMIKAEKIKLQEERGERKAKRKARSAAPLSVTES